MEDQIRNARLSFTCNQEWNSMKPDVDGRFCNSCQKKVYDLSDKNAAYFARIMQENNNSVCGRFAPEQMYVPALPRKLAGWKSLLMTLMAVIGISSCKQEGQLGLKETLGEPMPSVAEPECEDRYIRGVVLPMGFIDDKNKMLLQEYLFDNCALQNAVDGQYGISFNFRNNNIHDFSITGKFAKESKSKLLDAVKNGIQLISKDMLDGYPYQFNIIIKNGKIDSVLN